MFVFRFKYKNVKWWEEKIPRDDPWHNELMQPKLDLKTFRVTATREVEESATFDVEAVDKEEAIKIANQKMIDEEIEWDDGEVSYSDIDVSFIGDNDEITKN